MSQGDGAAVDIDDAFVAVGCPEFPLVIQTKLLHGINGLGCKGLIDFPHADVLDLQAGHLEQLGNGISRAHAHFIGLAPGDDISHQLGDRLDAQPFNGVFAHDQGGGSAVRGLGRVAGRNRTWRPQKPDAVWPRPSMVVGPDTVIKILGKGLGYPLTVFFFKTHGRGGNDFLVKPVLLGIGRLHL
jgi:hypothetical protein